MTATLSFEVRELIPYINWVYFYHAWGVKEEQATELKEEALKKLARWCMEDGKKATFRVRLFGANSVDEDILLYEYLSDDGGYSYTTLYTLPLLRQQREPYLCLADFVAPLEFPRSTIGVFASTANFPTDGLLEQTLADRLAEAAAELGHEITRKEIWGYASNENLTPQQLFAEHYQGKRPAVGYPSLPDQSLNFLLGEILDFKSMGITLTENGAMIPHASTSGLMFSHPQCRHINIGTIGKDQLNYYAKRRGMEAEVLKKYLDVSSI